MGEANRFPRTRCILKQDIQLTVGSGFEITERASLSIIEHSVVETSLSSLQDEGSACLLGEADRPVSHCSIGTMLIQGITMSEVRERESLSSCHRAVSPFVRPPLFYEIPPLFAWLAYSQHRPPIDKFPPYAKKKEKRNFPSRELPPFESIGNVPIGRHETFYRAFKN